jgi:hypothetical protein
MFRPDFRRDLLMRNAGLALALVASAQLTILSSPAFAQDDNSKAAAQTPSETSTEGAPAKSSGQDAKQKEKTGWIVLGVGGVAFVTGVVFDIVGGFSGTIAGAGGPGDQGETSNARHVWVFAGTTLIVAGLAAGVYGASTIISARKGADPTNSARPPEDASTSDSVTKAAQARAASAPSIVVPIIGATF